MSGEATFSYDPNTEPDHPLKPGATIGHVVTWSGGPGPAQIANAVALVDDEGHVVIDFGDFEDCEVVP